MILNFGELMNKQDVWRGSIPEKKGTHGLSGQISLKTPVGLDSGTVSVSPWSKRLESLGLYDNFDILRHCRHDKKGSPYW